jgi:hypothetical protein
MQATLKKIKSKGSPIKAPLFKQDGKDVENWLNQRRKSFADPNSPKIPDMVRSSRNSRMSEEMPRDWNHTMTNNNPITPAVAAA